MADASPNGQVPAVRDPNSGGGSFGVVPQMTYGMTFREIGNSGLRAFAGYVREEFLPQLQGRQAMTVYREMSDNSPVIGGMVFAINATMRKVNWRTVPASDTPEAQEAADFADSLREDMSTTWEDTIAEGLSMVSYGFAPLELCYKRRLGRRPGPDPMRPGRKLPSSKYDDGKIGWATLPIRGQDTVIKWFFDENGEWLGYTQQPWTGPLVDVPAEKTLLFRPSQHKGNPEGRSILRNAYRSYYMVKRIEEQEAILFERLNGIPVIRVPNQVMMGAQAGDADAIAVLEGYKKIAVNLRIDEQMGLVLPSDTFEGVNGPSTVPMYNLELIAPGGGKGSGGGSNSNDVVNRHNNLMMMSTLADFLILGHGPNGTESLSDSKKGMFFQATEGYLNSMAAVFNRHGLERVWELNGLDPELMPTYEPDLAQEVDLDVLSNFLQRLAQSGMALFPNSDLESALMDAAGLPDISDPSAMDLLDAASEGPQAIVGPQAAAATAELMPEPDPANEKPVDDGSPADQLRKMVAASAARRIQKLQGNQQHSINTMRKRQLPKPRQSIVRL